MNHFDLISFAQLRLRPPCARHNLAIQLYGDAIALQAKFPDQPFDERGLGESFKSARLTVQNNC